jgi:hypothetical protein
MSFCGHCGYLLAPNTIRCPRCGTPVETPGKAEGASSDTPTILSQQGNTIPQEDRDYSPEQSISQQETAWMANNDNYATNISPTTGPYHPADTFEQTATPHAPAEAFYPPQTPLYPDYPSGNNNDASLQREDISYPGFTTSPTTDYPQNLYLAPSPTTGKRNSAALVLAIIAFILAATLTTALLFAKPGILPPILHHDTSTPTAAISPTPVATQTPEQQAQVIIEQYFSSINHKNYQRAYDLWVPPPSSYNDFVNGFAHTRHDYIRLGTITQQNDGTVQVPVVITALTDSGTQQTFSGYYIVGQQPDGSWKITSAKIAQGTGS